MEQNDVNDRPSSSQNVQIGGSAVFPGMHGYDSFYAFATEPMNLSKVASTQPIDLSAPTCQNSSSPMTSPSLISNGNKTTPVQKSPVNKPSANTHVRNKPVQLKPKASSQCTNRSQASIASSQASICIAPSPALSQQPLTFATSPIGAQSASQKMILLMQSSQQASTSSQNVVNLAKTNTMTVLPLNPSIVTPQASHQRSTGKPAVSSPAIQAALNQPLKPKPAASKISTVDNKNGAGHQAPTMMHILNMPPLGQGNVKTQRSVDNENNNCSNTAVKPLKHLPNDSSSPGLWADTKFVKVEELTACTIDLPSTSSKYQAIKPLITTTSDGSLYSNGKSSEGISLLKPKTETAEEKEFNPIDLTTAYEELQLPSSPRSVLEMRLYKKKNRHLAKLRKSTQEQLVVSTPLLPSSSSSAPSTTTDTNSIIDFDWTTYLKSTNYKAAPHSAFKHPGFHIISATSAQEWRKSYNCLNCRTNLVIVVEASLYNGFMVGMKVETPLRDSDSDKYWLASIISVYGPILRLRYDGYGDEGAHDFLLHCNSENIHPIGWCSKHQKSLLPPAGIRHTQKQWKNFLLNALQGAKTLPPFLLNKRSGPWSFDRIRPGMRLEVQHANILNAVWIAKVLRNIGGRLKLRYEGSIDDLSDFWMFYRDQRIHPCNWALGNNCIYRPPNEIKDIHTYDIWKKILHNVSKDCNLEKMPSDLLSNRDCYVSHSFRLNTAVEVVHPSGLYIFPARVSHIINEYYFAVEMLLSSESAQKFTMCCSGGSPYVLPVGWCYNHSVKLELPDNEIVEPRQFWDHYLSELKLQPLVEGQHSETAHEFKPYQCLEAVNPTKPDQICVGYVKKIIGRLMWVKIYTDKERTSTVIYDVNSSLIFPAGWCDSNNYPLSAPKLDPSESVDYSGNLNDDVCPRIYFNNRCFSGPHLSKGRLLKLPIHLGPGPMALVLRKAMNLITSVAYKPVRVAKLLQLQGPPNPNMSTITITARHSEKSNEVNIEICTKRSEVAEFCKQICTKLECCPNLLSVIPVKNQCSENCHVQTKTQYLYVERRPGRPPGSGRNGSKKKKRKKRKHLLHTQTSLPNARQASESDNCSASSNADEPNSPKEKLQMQNLTAEEKPKPTVSTKTTEVNSTAASPLYQLQLTSIQNLPDEATPQYQIVKRKRGRPPKQSIPESTKVKAPSSPKTHLTVPPLKIRRLELSPPQPTLCNIVPKDTTSQTSTTVLFSYVTAPCTVTRPSKTDVNSKVNQKLNASGTQDRGGLLKATTPLVPKRSALTFTRARIHVEDRDKVQLTDNPLEWDADRLASFIKGTDCAYLADMLVDHEIDGQAFMMLVLPTVQEELELKLGPALKLCYQVQRLKLAFYETFHPND